MPRKELRGAASSAPSSLSPPLSGAAVVPFAAPDETFIDFLVDEVLLEWLKNSQD